MKCNICRKFHEPPECPRPDPTPRDLLGAQIRARIADVGRADLVGGALGDGNNMSAYVDRVEYPTGGGVLTYFFGIKYPYKGSLNSTSIDAVAQVKRVFLATLLLIYKRPFRYLAPLLLIRKVREDAIDWAVRICEANLLPKLPKYHLLTSMSRHLIQTLCFALGVPLPEVPDQYLESGERTPERILQKLVISFVSFPELDNSYRFPLQDAFGTASKVGVVFPIEETERILNLMIGRSKAIGLKIETLKKMLLFVLKVSPPARRIASRFYDKLDVEKVKLDDRDWYYCLRRRTYDYRGFSYEERSREAEQIDKEEGNIVLGI